MSITIAERAGPAVAPQRGATFGAWDAWHRLSLRAKLLLVFILVDLVAAFVIGSVTIMRARTSTRVEIAASMALAETLVTEAIEGANARAVRSLAEHASRQRLMRHVRLSVRNAAHLPVPIAPQRDQVGIRIPIRTKRNTLQSPHLKNRPAAPDEMRFGS